MVLNIKHFGFRIEEYRPADPWAHVSVFTGHSLYDPGANGKHVGIPEYEFALNTDVQFAKLCAANGISVDHYIRYTPGWAGWKPMKNEVNRRHKNNPCHLLIMDHYNDMWPKEHVNGGMVCHWWLSSKGKKAAGIFRRHLCAHFGIKEIYNLALKPFQRANKLVETPKPVAIILEKGMGSSPVDGPLLLAGRDTYHTPMVKATVEYLRDVVGLN